MELATDSETLKLKSKLRSNHQNLIIENMEVATKEPKLNHKKMANELGVSDSAN